MKEEQFRTRTLLTLEERLALAARSQAVSPETATKLVQRLFKVHTANFFCGSSDMNIMLELIGEYMEYLEDSLFHYGGFCYSFRIASVYNKGGGNPSRLWSGTPTDKDGNPYRPFFSTRVNNAIVLLGEILLDHVKDRMWCKDIYHCTRMTVGQYLDALCAIRPIEVRPFRETLLKDYDGSLPLGEMLADILKRYIAAWQEFDHLDHILRCMGALAYYLEENEAGEAFPELEAGSVKRFREALCQYGPDLEGQELVEADKRYLDPCGYYFTLANEYTKEVPDPDSPDLAPKTLRLQIFLPERDYSPEALRALAAQSPFPDLRALLEKSISGDRLARAMVELNKAVTHLYMLWVAPYLWMGIYLDP